MHLYHYFDKKIGPFVNLSDISTDEAMAVMLKIKETKPNTIRGQNPDVHAYLERRQLNEGKLKTEFERKGGIVKRNAPHYMVIEHSPWLNSEEWFENNSFIKIPIEAFDTKTISFTYGDSFPVLSPYPSKMDDKEYKNQVYTYDEILRIIDKYGLPQHYNHDGSHGPERYIEAHVWSDETINKYRY